MRHSLLPLSLLLLTATDAGALERKLVRRTLTITAASSNVVHEIRVAGGISTTLVFQVPIKEGGVILADSSRSFFPPQIIDRSILLVPRKDVRRRRPKTLTVTLADGTVIPFKLVSSRMVADLQVDVSVTASPDSPQTLKSTVTQLQGALDECQSNVGNAGIQKVASLIAGQDIQKPQAFTVERRDVRDTDKQARLLVQLHSAYRLFGQTYLVLTVQNRDPSKSWVLDKPEVGLMGESQTEEVKVVTFSAELASLPPDEKGKVVVAFNTPPQGKGNRFYLSLLEKNGNRHVRLDDLSL